MITQILDIEEEDYPLEGRWCLLNITDCENYKKKAVSLHLYNLALSKLGRDNVYKEQDYVYIRREAVSMFILLIKDTSNNTY